MINIIEGRKVHQEYDNPIDHFLLHFVDIVNPLCYKINFTPNILTTISGIFGLLSVYSIYNGYMIYGGIFILISYFFDCCDGNFARRYDMVTKFGDYYDHVKDNLVMILLFVAFIKQNKININKIKYIVVIVWILLFIMSFVFFGCQEKIYNTPEHSETLKILTCTCYGDPKETILIVRWIGSGTIYLLVAITLIVIGLIYKK